MPIIKEEDLIGLHDKIEESQVEQEKLKGLLDLKDQKLKNANVLAHKLRITCVVLVVLFSGYLIYTYAFSGPDSIDNFSTISSVTEERNEVIIDSLKEEIKALKKTNVKLQDLRNIYLYRKLIAEDTIYSVQVQSFREEKIASITDKFSNALVYEGEDFFKLSLGLFETVKEARYFRRQLIRAGFSNKIFVISYLKGERVKIENPF
ncbi:hypothetical protein [Aquimarina brevivitae]|uniref:Sporulation related protein n=1 Tax=Aquimarina brevivitae TaxID=323412 RepID=A0A4Q7P1U0_9FLAO|nr:hypothetical protein [Aquimarina brevivitae]RZS93695.1 hypothetical protein EV197_2275 [Aquimarina brevivitae]